MSRATMILIVMALFVLFYFSGNYMLSPIIKTLHEEGLITGGENVWRLNASLLKTVPGFVGLAFTFFLGVLGDRLGRRRLILLLGIVMGVSLILVSTATNFYQLLTYLIMFGIGIVGISPIIYAFVADVVPGEGRGKGYAAYYAASVLGMVVGILLAGIFFHWRTAFLIAGSLTLVFGIGLHLLSEGVTIGYSERSEIGGYSLREAVKEALTPSVVIVMAQMITWAMPWGMLVYFAIEYVDTRWGIGQFYASILIIVAAVSIAVGHIFGGVLSDRLVKKQGPLGRVKVSVLGIAVGYVAMVMMLAYPYPYGDTSLWALLPPFIIAALGMMFTTFAYPNISTVVSDCVKPEHRSTVFSLYNILNNIGWAMGPFVYGALVALLSDAGIDTKVAMMYSAISVVSLWLISLGAWMLLAKHYPKDIERVRT